MHRKEDVLEEINNIRLQLDMVQVAADTASDDSKEAWCKKRDILQKRLEELQDLFLNFEEQEHSVTEEPVIVDASASADASELSDADADAMLRAILSADDSQTPDSDTATTEKMADAMIEHILTANEPPLQQDFDADKALDAILSADEPTPSADATANVMAEAMIDSILSTNDRAQEPVVQMPPVDDATADAMLNDILAATEPEFAVPPIDTDAIVEQIFADPVVMDDAAKASEYAESVRAGETVIFPEADTADDSDEVFRAVAEAEKHAPDKRPEAEPMTAEKTDKKEESEKLTLNTVDPDIANEILREIMTANERIAEMQQAQAVLTAESKQDTAKETFTSDSGTSGVTNDFDVANAEAMLQVEMLKMEAQEANRKAQEALLEAEKMKKEAEQIKLTAETERAMYAAEMELQRGLRNEEENMRKASEQAAKDKLVEKIARRKNEITAIRNGLQDVKDTDSAFLLREKLFSIQLVLDEEERNSPEIMYLLTKSMDDVSHAVEVSELKRRIAALTAALKKPAKKSSAKKPVDKKAAAKKKAAKAKAKKAAVKKKAAARRGRPPVRGLVRSAPAKHRYMTRPSSPSPRAYR